MQQQRPAAELLPVARLPGEEKKLLVAYWLARLKDLPVSAGKRLAGAPLAALDVSRSTELTGLSPLAGLALIELNLSGTSVDDLAPLSAQRLKRLSFKAAG